MTHLSENAHRLNIIETEIHDRESLLEETLGFAGVLLVRLPFAQPEEQGSRLDQIEHLLARITTNLHPQSVLITFGDTPDLVHVHNAVAQLARYHLWIALKLAKPRASQDSTRLPSYHAGALVHTITSDSLNHTKTRIAYTYCPACDKTTKDYGGKKHTYHQYGTLISDVWRDITCDPDGSIDAVVDRFADLFGLQPYQTLKVLDLRPMGLHRVPTSAILRPSVGEEQELTSSKVNTLINGDCLEELANIPDNSIDFAFVDPPYNLGKSYTGYSDELEIAEYFEWCDEWLSELGRVLRPGRTLSVLNIPLWTIRHFIHLETILEYQNWIAWDALAYPVRQIMPAHYSIVCFSKGTPRKLPGLIGQAGKTDAVSSPTVFDSLNPLAEWYCLRQSCINKRHNDRGPLTDLWWDIHRLKHNSRRVDHPTQLPPHLMYRLISVFTKPGEVVLDCFNGSGTTTLAAHQLGRRYVGIEKADKYHQLALSRHEEIRNGLDPFRKREGGRKLAKNSPVPRMKKQSYEIPKKTLQLEVRRVAQLLGHLPSREELIEHGKYSIRYYDEYFVSWGEVCAAARTTGMSEDRPEEDDSTFQLRLL